MNGGCCARGRYPHSARRRLSSNFMRTSFRASRRRFARRSNGLTPSLKSIRGIRRPYLCRARRSRRTSCVACRRKSAALRTGSSSLLWMHLRDAEMAGPPGLRVVHLVPALFGPAGVVGGAERYALELARHMADRVPTRLLTFGAQAEQTRIGNLDVRIVADAFHVCGQPNNPLSTAIFGEILKADVVHCHQQHVVMSSTAALACRLAGRRVFTTDLGGGGWDVSAYLSTDRWFHGHLHLSEYSLRLFGHDRNGSAH